MKLIQVLAYAIALFASGCDEDPWGDCERGCGDAREVCIEVCREQRDACKAVCVENFPEYMDCYWYCRIELKDQPASFKEACLEKCAEDHDPTGEAVTCVSDCDLAFDSCIPQCEDDWDVCWNGCYE
jgi:hypothetical protein